MNPWQDLGCFCHWRSSVLWKKNTSHWSTEKLTHGFKQTLHDNHPLIFIVGMWLNQVVKWNQWCVIERNGNVFVLTRAGMGNAGMLKWMTLRQVTQVYCASEHSFSNMLPLWDWCSLLPSTVNQQNVRKLWARFWTHDFRHETQTHVILRFKFCQGYDTSNLRYCD